MKPILAALAFAAVSALPARGAILTEEVDYRDGATVLQGYFAYDGSSRAKRPAVLVVHEWYGHGPYARRRARDLAKLGYLAFACDMYGKGLYANTHEEAGKLMAPVKADRGLMRRRALAALGRMKRHPLADPSRTAAIGYCFGGTTVLELARSGADLRGVASFHGGLDTPEPEKTAGLKAKVLVLQGGDDGFTLSGLPAFEEEMRKAKADWQVVTYGGAVHSFTVPEAGDDPSKGMAYNAEADRRSWQEMQYFFREIFSR